MIRTVGIIERSVLDKSLPPIVLVANVAADIIADSLADEEELAGIQLYNAGVNPAYYAYGRDCSAANYNAILAAGQMLDVQTRQRVSMLSVAGTTIGITYLIRGDFTASKNIL